MKPDPRVIHCENCVLLALPLISGALNNVHKALSRGYVESEMRGAVADLRHAAVRLEAIMKEWPEEPPK